YIRKVDQFIQKFSIYPAFMLYFKNYYLEYECAFKWTRAYQIQILTNVETNNYIESWHDQLKTNYLQRKRNRRLDRLIFILIDDVHDNFMHNTARMAANIGRMSSETREARKMSMSCH
ncbi:hypothetical protein BCV71DRAFT_271178, partial [Rhizopus microsporus]